MRTGDATNALDDDSFAHAGTGPDGGIGRGEVPAFAQLGDGDDEVDLAVDESLFGSLDDFLSFGASGFTTGDDTGTEACLLRYLGKRIALFDIHTEGDTAHGVRCFLTVLTVGSKSCGVLFDEGCVCLIASEDLSLLLFGEGAFKIQVGDFPIDGDETIAHEDAGVRQVFVGFSCDAGTKAVGDGLVGELGGSSEAQLEGSGLALEKLSEHGLLVSLLFFGQLRVCSCVFFLFFVEGIDACSSGGAKRAMGFVADDELTACYPLTVGRICLHAREVALVGDDSDGTLLDGGAGRQSIEILFGKANDLLEFTHRLSDEVCAGDEHKCAHAKEAGDDAEEHGLAGSSWLLEVARPFLLIFPTVVREELRKSLNSFELVGAKIDRTVLEQGEVDTEVDEEFLKEAETADCLQSFWRRCLLHGFFCFLTCLALDRGYRFRVSQAEGESCL